MIKIFDENDRVFNSNGNISLDPIKCIEVKKKSLNGWYIDCEINVKYKDFISNGKLVVIKSKSKVNPQAFRICDGFTEEDNIISFKAKHVMFDAENYHLLDVRPENKNGIAAIEYINERTDITSPFNVYSNVQTTATAYFIRKSLLEAWEIMEERWGGIFDADNWDIRFLSSISIDNGAAINYGKNIQGIQIYEDWSNVVTKICPVGFDGLLLPEKYLIADIQYPTPYTKTISFETDLDIEDQTEENLIVELRQNAQKYLNENKYPKVSYEVISNINQDMAIGEIIHVKHPLVTILTEVIEYEYNTNTKRIEKLVFGNFVRDVRDRFAEYRESVEKIAHHASKQDEVINKQTDLINNLGKEGHFYYDENEWLIMDADDIEKAVNLWRGNLGGIGFSRNGYNGPFEIALTMDGQINADMITTGKLNVARIEGLEEYTNNNLLRNSNFSENSSIAKGWNESGSNGNGFSRSLVVAHGKTWLHLANTNTSIRWYGLSQAGIVGEFKPAKKYTVSFLAYGTGNVRIGIHEKLSGSGIIEQYWKSVEVDSEIKKYSYTFTTTSSKIDNYNFMIYGQDFGVYDFYITELKFEESEYATEWNTNYLDHIKTAIALSPDSALISADLIDIYGKTINMTTNNFALTSTNFSVTKDGILTSKSGVFEDVTIKSSGTYGKIDISQRMHCCEWRFGKTNIRYYKQFFWNLYCINWCSNRWFNWNRQQRNCIKCFI